MVDFNISWINCNGMLRLRLKCIFQKESLLCFKHLLAFEVGSSRLGRVNLIRRTGEHILVDKQEVSILAGADAAALILDEHLLGHINGKSSKGLFAGDEFLGPPRVTVLAMSPYAPARTFCCSGYL